MPSYVKYNYKNGEIPGHTKLAFLEYGILTVQHLIAHNAFLFIKLEIPLRNTTLS